MFSKASNSKPSQSSSSADGAKIPPKKTGVPSIISPDLRVNGDLVCSGDIQIDGWIEGDIQSRNVVVGESATVHGAIQAENVRICGSVNGQVRADNVTLEKSARVTGDILHKSLSIEQGAFLEGMCKRIDTAPAIPQIEPRPLLAPKDTSAVPTTPRDKVAAIGAPAGAAAVN
jgi:cytoskeletal protein CcmA (bactofilin family)